MLCFNIMHNYIVEIQETSLASTGKYTGKYKAISNTILIVTNSGKLLCDFSKLSNIFTTKAIYCTIK